MNLSKLKNLLKSPVAKALGKQVATALVTAAVAKLTKKKTP
jgi:hypothetical protein